MSTKNSKTCQKIQQITKQIKLRKIPRALQQIMEQRKIPQKTTKTIPIFEEWKPRIHHGRQITDYAEYYRREGKESTYEIHPYKQLDRHTAQYKYNISETQQEDVKYYKKTQHQNARKRPLIPPPPGAIFLAAAAVARGISRELGCASGEFPGK